MLMNEGVTEIGRAALQWLGRCSASVGQVWRYSLTRIDLLGEGKIAQGPVLCLESAHGTRCQPLIPANGMPAL